MGDPNIENSGPDFWKPLLWALAAMMVAVILYSLFYGYGIETTGGDASKPDRQMQQYQ